VRNYRGFVDCPRELASSSGPGPPRELEEILTLQAAHGTDALTAARERAVTFGRWRADDIRSILAAAGAAPLPRPAGQALVLTLPQVPTRPLSDYALRGEPS
jgi:hypothetical protein